MSEAGSDLQRLCERVGIAAEFTDIWGRTHGTSDATRLALLQAMGVIADESGVAEALAERERWAWQRGLPAVTVCREDAPPYRWEICFDERAATRAVRCLPENPWPTKPPWWLGRADV